MNEQKKTDVLVKNPIMVSVVAIALGLVLFLVGYFSAVEHVEMKDGAVVDGKVVKVEYEIKTQKIKKKKKTKIKKKVENQATVMWKDGSGGSQQKTFASTSGYIKTLKTNDIVKLRLHPTKLSTAQLEELYQKETVISLGPIKGTLIILPGFLLILLGIGFIIFTIKKKKTAVPVGQAQTA